MFLGDLLILNQQIAKFRQINKSRISTNKQIFMFSTGILGNTDIRNEKYIAE